MFKMTGVAVCALYSHVKDSEKTLIIRHALNTGNTSFLQVLHSYCTSLIKRQYLFTYCHPGDFTITCDDSFPLEFWCCFEMIFQSCH